MAVTGWIITMFAEMFGVELAAIVEASTEETAKAEDKKAEKTPLKEEANKEVHKDVEIKVDEREKPKVPVFLFDVSPGFVRPVVLSKLELDLLPEPLKIPMDLSHRQVINNENNKSSQKPEKAEPKEPKVAVYPSAPKTTTGTGQVIREPYGCNSSRGRRGSYKEASSQPAQSSVSNGQPNQTSENTLGKSAQESASGRKVSNQSAKNPVSNGKALEQSNQASRSAPGQSARSSVADCECNFPVGLWKGAEHEGSVGDAQPPKGLTNDVKVEKCVEGQSVGKTP
jgi:hypothetical protein